MKYLKHDRSIGWIAVVAALFLFSGNASAVAVSENINIGGFANAGSLNLMFSGEAGGDDILDELELGTFTAAYNDDGTVGPISWAIGDVGVLAWDAAAGNLLNLSADNLDFQLNVAGNVFDDDNYAEIFGFDFDFNLELLAFSTQFPDTDSTPAPTPGTLLLLALGLLALGRRRA